MSVLGYRETPNDNNADSIPGGFPTTTPLAANNIEEANDFMIPRVTNISQVGTLANNTFSMFLRIPLFLLYLILNVLITVTSFIDRFLRISTFYSKGRNKLSHEQEFDSLLESLSASSVSAIASQDTHSFNFGSIYNKDNGVIGCEQLMSSFLDLKESCLKQCKYGFIYLHDPLLDDAMGYPNNILCSESFVNLIKKYQGLVWFGDVTTSESLQVSNIWKVRQYPFLAVIMVRSSGKAEVVVSTSGSIDNHDPLKFETLLQQNHGKLIQVAQQRQNADMERLIRGQQDSRFRESLRRDQERDRVQEAERRAEREQQNTERMKRKWLLSRLHRLHPEPTTRDNTSRIAIRLENSERLVRRFDADLPIEEIYAFVELHQCGMLDENLPTEEVITAPVGYAHHYNFLLISPVPRVELAPEMRIADCDAIFPSGNIIIEDIDSPE